MASTIDLRGRDCLLGESWRPHLAELLRLGLCSHHAGVIIQTDPLPKPGTSERAGADAAIPDAARDDIIRAGRRMDARGFVPATAGNISVRLDGGAIAITRSGGHKGFLTRESVIAVDLDGQVLTPGARPSAETLLHCQIYRHYPAVRAVLHGHSVAGTVLSLEERAPTLLFQGYEVQKIFANQTTHENALALPLVANDQDMVRLAGMVGPRLADAPMGYLIRGHGIYVWAEDMDMALARLEGLEFLLACALERRRK